MAQGNLTLFNPPAPEPDPGYGQLLGVLMRRKVWFLGALAGTIALAAAVTAILPATYRSTMQMLVESNYRERRTPNDARPSFADPNVESDSATQVNLMRSTQLLQRAVDDLKPRYSDIDVDHLRKWLNIAQIQELRGNERVTTNIVEMSFIDKDRIKTREVLKSLQKVYQDYNLEQQRNRLNKGLSFIDGQIPQVQAKVDKAEADLERFRKSTNLVDPEVQSKALVDSLRELQKDQQTNRGELASAQAKFYALQQQLARSPEQVTIAAKLSQSKQYQALLAEIQKTEVALAQQQTRFTDKTPFVQQLLEQRQRQIGLLQQEAQRVLGADAGVIAQSGEGLFSTGQLGENDLKFASDLTTAQVEFFSARARDQALASDAQRLQAQLQRFPSLLSEYNRLQPAVKLNRDTLDELQKARQDLGLEIARGGFDWQTVEQPKLGRQVGPNWLRNLLIGGAAGAMIGSVAAFLRESADKSIRTSEDLTKQASIPLIGMVPELPMSELMPTNFAFGRSTAAGDTSMLQVLHWAPFRESLDLIYKNLQLMTDGSPMRSLVVTSALAGEGKSTVALGLAISAARLHQRVLLIDADLRRPGLHHQLQLPNDHGLSTLLTSDRALTQAAIQPASTYSDLPISVLTAGPTPTDSVKLLSSKRMRDLMTVFEQHYDLVILDAPPVLGIVDALLAASFCDGALLVGRMGHVDKNEVTQAVGMLSRLNLVGVVANCAESGNSYYYRSATATA
ncbi:MAG: polysaccharide biosynthesis tyrosine autokinase [Phormidium tanganyikae FI6-MK23]|nr:polysaccharide biosynthesis tyrosine autokinase [Phormidium tanganyikae FI6-MK23]